LGINPQLHHQHHPFFLTQPSLYWGAPPVTSIICSDLCVDLADIEVFHHYIRDLYPSLAFAYFTITRISETLDLFVLLVQSRGRIDWILHVIDHEPSLGDNTTPVLVREPHTILHNQRSVKGLISRISSGLLPVTLEVRSIRGTQHLRRPQVSDRFSFTKRSIFHSFKDLYPKIAHTQRNRHKQFHKQTQSSSATYTLGA
jgi:hypothetical protein